MIKRAYKCEWCNAVNYDPENTIGWIEIKGHLEIKYKKLDGTIEVIKYPRLDFSHYNCMYYWLRDKIEN